MFGSTLIGLGIVVLMWAFNGGGALAGFIGVILIVVGGILFWSGSATKKYLDQNKNQNKR